VKSQACPLVGIDPAGALPPRSALVRLEPRGLQTPYRESLGSYFQRLADAHSLMPTALATGIVIPSINRSGSPRRGEYIWRYSIFNGNGAVAEEWAKALGSLTGQFLKHLTLLAFKSALSGAGLMARARQWCPMCLHEGVERGAPYGHLLWEIGVVRACPKHAIKLVTRCGCIPSNKNRAFRKRLPWLCEFCGHSLACIDQSVCIPADVEEINRACLVAEFLNIEPGELTDCRTRENIGLFLRAVVNAHFDGKSAKLARALGLQKSVLHCWVNAQHVPPLSKLLDIAVRCSVPLRALVLDGDARGVVSVNSMAPTADRRRAPVVRRRVVDFETLRSGLEAIATQDRPVSLECAAKALACDSSQLRRHFPSLTKAISNRYKTYLRGQHAEKFRKRQTLWAETANRLLKDGIVPTRARVAAALQGVDVIFSPGDRKRCAAICRDVVAAAALR